MSEEGWATVVRTVSPPPGFETQGRKRKFNQLDDSEIDYIHEMLGSEYTKENNNIIERILQRLSPDVLSELSATISEESGETYLTQAASDCTNSIVFNRVKILSKYLKLYDTNREGETPLMRCCVRIRRAESKGNNMLCDTAQYLARIGPKSTIEQESRDGYTPLWEIAQRGINSLVKVLLECGAEPSPRPREDRLFEFTRDEDVEITIIRGHAHQFEQSKIAKHWRWVQRSFLKSNTSLHDTPSSHVKIAGIKALREGRIEDLKFALLRCGSPVSVLARSDELVIIAEYLCPSVADYQKYLETKTPHDEKNSVNRKPSRTFHGDIFAGSKTTSR
ncbi:hypothetical protein AAMO2058_001009900 [Amorphochlora amoebiformis]